MKQIGIILRKVFVVCLLMIVGGSFAWADNEMCSAYLTATSGNPTTTNCTLTYSGGTIPGGTQLDSYYYSQLTSGYYEITLSNSDYTLFQAGYDVLTVYLYSNESEVGYKIGETEYKLTGLVTGKIVELSHTIAASDITETIDGGATKKIKIQISPYGTKTYFAGVKVTTTRSKASGNEVYFVNNNIVFTSSGVTQPATEGENMYFQQDLLWQWSGQDEIINLTKSMTADHDFVWTVDVTGDLTVPSGKYLRKSIDNKSYLIEGVNNSSGTKIYFTGNSGTIKVTATNPDYGGRTYSCSYTIYYHVDSKKWDFYTKRLAVGRVADAGSLINTNSGDWTHVSVASSITGEITEEAYFYNKRIPETGDNPVEIVNDYAHIEETQYKKSSNPDTYDVLKFYAPADCFGLYNENSSEGICGDRYLALKPGAKVVIPASVYSAFSNPRIRIKMGRYGGVDASTARIDLTIVNAKDALGTNIASTDGAYKIGGSAWWGDKKDNNQRGEYHFMLQDNSQDFSIKVHAGQWLKLYSIEVYNSTELMTENSVLGDRYQLLNVGGTEGDDGVTGTYYLHYRGKGENTKIYTNNSVGGWDYWPTGTVTCVNSDFTNYNGTGNTHTYTSKIGQFGSFRIRLECYTHGNTYCTDYASRSQAVGYLKAVASYPYTWDFTDVKPYSNGLGRLAYEHGTTGYDTSGGIKYGEEDYAFFDRWDKRAAWESVSGVYGHRLGKDGGGHDVLFCGGSQLWYGQTIIPELAGLGFTPSNSSAVYNNTLEMTDAGLKINQSTRDWWCYRIAVPNVPADGVLYVRVKPERSDEFYNAGYSYGDYRKPISGDPGNVEVKFNSSNTFDAPDGDKIYVVPGNATSASSNITLYFNGVTIKKIAVAKDPKKVNKYGWATESRNHIIDPELTSYMTGQDFTTFLVTDVNYTSEKVTMTPIGSDQLMPSATNDGDPQACIIRNNAGTDVKIINDGFHLFVPDMHDASSYTYTTIETINETKTARVVNEAAKKTVVSTSESKLEAQLTSGTVPHTNAKNSDYTNFAFTYKYFNTTTGDVQGDLQEGAQSFYRIANGGASSTGNQGYLPLLKSQIPDDVASGSRGFSLMLDEEPESDVTAIETVWYNTSKADIYYNMNGQQLNGHPTRRGLYVVNGKKVYVK